MLAPPWDTVLTLVFLFTGAVCLRNLIAYRRTDPARRETLVDVNHALMSGGMIAMIWLPAWDATVWVQLALFTVLAVGVLFVFFRERGGSRRIDLAGHAALNVAMIWMIAAMPLLMSDGGGAHRELGGAEVDPIWVDMMNNVFVFLSGVWFLWWLSRMVTTRGHRLHSLYHAVMAAGMAVMLVLMNA